MPVDHADEDRRLQAAALKNAQSILAARQRAERALRAAQQALERSNEELREQREWLQVTLASIGDAVIATDAQGRVTFLNPVAEQMTGWTSAQARHRPLEAVFRIVNEDNRQPVENPVARVLHSGQVVSLANHAALLGKDGALVAIEDSAAPIRDAKGAITGTVMVFHDVSERRRAERALRETDRRKDEFLATLAHELRNPLAPIRQAAFIAQSPGATDAQRRWSHAVIDRQVQHMALLLDDLLDISRITRGTMELRTQTTELAAVVDAAVETARPIIDAKRHGFTVEVPAQPMPIVADPLRLAQVLSNLLTNAAKYTDPQGRIVLGVTCDAEWVTVTVSDSGVGIPPESLEAVFAMFSQVKASQDRSEGGLGIGLALSRGLVELHGGTIRATSAGSGQGSTFVVRLPRLGLAAELAADAKPPDNPAIVSRRILIADDNRDAADSLATVLRLDGHHVTVVHDGEQALAALRDAEPEFALLDIGMPKLNGYEVARRIRGSESGGAMMLVAVTGWGQNADKTQALAAGFDRHFTKPIGLDALAELLRFPRVRGQAGSSEAAS